MPGWHAFPRHVVAFTIVTLPCQLQKPVRLFSVSRRQIHLCLHLSSQPQEKMTPEEIESHPRIKL